MSDGRIGVARVRDTRRRKADQGNGKQCPHSSNFRVQRRPQAVRWNESLDTRRYCGRVGVRGQPLLPKGPTENRQGEAPASTEAAWRPIQVNLIGALRLRCSRRSEEHTSELQSPDHLVCRLLLEKKKKKKQKRINIGYQI